MRLQWPHLRTNRQVSRGSVPTCWQGKVVSASSTTLTRVRRTPQVRACRPSPACQSCRALRSTAQDHTRKSGHACSLLTRSTAAACRLMYGLAAAGCGQQSRRRRSQNRKPSRRNRWMACCPCPKLTQVVDARERHSGVIGYDHVYHGHQGHCCKGCLHPAGGPREDDLVNRRILSR